MNRGGTRAAQRPPARGRDLLLEVQRYWDTHPLGTQFLPSPGSPAAPVDFERLDRALDRWDYKPALIDRVAEQFAGGALLEIGCGLGTDLVRFARRGLHVTGVELAPAVATMARQHLAQYGLPGEILVGNAQALSVRDRLFDVVYTCGVLQHVPDIRGAVAEMRRVLRPGGLAVCVVYHRYSWFNALRHLGRVNVEFEDADPPIIHTYSRRQARRLFARFAAVTLRTEYDRPTPTPRRGTLATIYNRAFVPAMRRAPRALVRRFGWHLVITAVR